MADVVDFAPNDATHPAFGEALRQAKAAGVNITAYSCRVTPDSMAIDQPVEVLLWKNVQAHACTFFNR